MKLLSSFLTAWLLLWSIAAAGDPLDLERAVAQAIAEDPWLRGSEYRQSALMDEAEVAASLPNPKLSISAANLPTDSFDFGQEAMTQGVLGLSQMFPRGDSRALGRQQKQQMAEQQPFLRADRKAQVSATVTQLWLDLWRAQESIRLIDGDRALFEQLVEAAEAGYASAVGAVRQQDVIRAQLELTRLDDRLTQLRQQEEAAQRRLAEWLGEAAIAPVATDLPDVSLPTEQEPGQWRNRLARHPAVQAVDQQIEAVATDVAIAEQGYKPEWGINAQYGYRDQDPARNGRSDLFSLGVSVDLPLFGRGRQDRQVSAARSRTEAARTERALLLRRLAAELERARAELARLDQREELFRSQLLPQMNEQAEAALSAYHNDTGDFAEAVRARIAELNTKIESLSITVDRRKTLATLNYLLVAKPSGAAEEDLL